MNEELELIVQKMMDAGESEDAIKEVIKTYKASPAAPVKKKEATEFQSPAGPVPSASGGSGPETNSPDPTAEVTPQQPTQAPSLIQEREVDPFMANLYKEYKKAGQVTPEQTSQIKAKVKAQADGDRGFWETALAVTEGYLKTGMAIPLFSYNSEKELTESREEKNKTNFLSNLPEEKVAELKTYAGHKMEQIDNKNLNILAQNKMLEERGKEVANDLKYKGEGIKKLQEMGKPLPPQVVSEYEMAYAEAEGIALEYNKNFDILENNMEDLGDFNQELGLLKKNYGGLDYYMDLARLTTASLGAGVAKYAKEMGDASGFINPNSPAAIFSHISEESIQDFTDEVARQQSELRPSTSVHDIDSWGSFGGWLGEQVATQLPIITTLAMTGGTTGLGILGTAAAGQKITELEAERTQARESIPQIEAAMESGDLSEEEYAEAEREIRKLSGKAEGSDAEFLMAGTGFGLLEAGTERITLGILSKGKRAWMAALKEGKRADVLKGLGQGSIAAGQEGGSEFVNAFGGNIIDFLYLNNSDVHIFDNTIDALASGAALGFGMRVAPAAVGIGAKAFMPKAESDGIRQRTQQIANLLGEIEVNAETIDPDTKKLIKRKAAKLTQEVRDEIKKSFGVISRMAPTDIQRLIDIDKESNRIAEQANTIRKSNIEKETKTELLADLKTKVETLKEEKQTLIDNAPKRKKGEPEPLADRTLPPAEGTTTETGEVGTTEATEDTSATENAERPSIAPIGRTIKIINPFTTAKPLAEIAIGETLDSKLDAFNTKIVDRFFNIKKIQSTIERMAGGKGVKKRQDFRQAEVTMHGKTADQLKNFQGVVESLVKDIANSEIAPMTVESTDSKGKKVKTTKTSIDRVSEFLYARHAQERNKHIREIPIREVDGVPQGEVNDSGSGMTDAKAQEILDSYTEAEMLDMQRIADRVDTIMQETRDILLNSGLITKLQHDVLSKYYKNYVPLQGYASEEIESDVMSAYGLSMSIKGKETKLASGRTTMADNVLYNIIAMRNSAVVRAEKNEVMKSLYNLAKANPDSDVWQLYSAKRPDVSFKRDPSSGKKGYYPENMQNTKKYVGVKINGNQHYIKFANQRLAETLNASSIEKTDIVTKTLGKFNRYMSSVLTTYNPEFMISNFERDIQTAVINMMSETDIAKNSLKGKSFVGQTIKNTPAAIKAIIRGERGRPGRDALDKFYKEFKEDGAKTDWFYADNVEGIKKSIDDIVKLQKGQKRSLPKKAFKSLIKTLDDYNTGVENGVRLSAYMAARNNGVSRADAAEFAKELTINFNQKGEWGTVLNSYMLFFNAAIQGTARFTKAMTTLKREYQDDGSVKYGLNRAQKVAGALAMASSLNTMMNMMLSDDDEDGVSYYDKIQDWEKERNLIFMSWNGKDHYKVPLPYGYNIFHNFGTVAAEVGMGSRSVGDGVGFMINSMIGAFFPLTIPASEKGMLAKFSKTVSPTILKPALEIAINEDHFGSSIYSENFPVGVQKPEASLGRPTTGAVFREIANFMNEATGGSEFVSGWGDVNPDKIEHLFDFFGGGTFKFVSNSMKTGTYLFKTAQGEEVEIEARQVPILRKFVGSAQTKYVNQEVYYARRDMLDQLKAELESKDPKERKDERYEGVLILDKRQKKTEKKLKKVRERIKRYNNTIEDPIEKSKKIKEAREEEESIISSFNKEYNKLRKD